MTQQAGVSAEGWIYAKVEHVTEDGLIVARHWRPLECAPLNALIAKWREEAETGTLRDITHALGRCANELEAVLATAPPEQAASEDSWSKLERHTKAMAKAQPQPVSAGALDSEIVNPYPIRCFSCGTDKPGNGHTVPLCGDCYEQLRVALPLASHDQKVRAEVREEIRNALICDQTTGAGDYDEAVEYADRIVGKAKENHPQDTQDKPRTGLLLDALAAPAPAASKPASEGEVNEQNS